MAMEARHAVAAVDAASGVTGILSALNTLTPIRSHSVSWQRKLAEEELYKLPNTFTPYGNICCGDVVHGKVDDLEVYHVNPFALFYYACEVYEGFRNFLAALVAAFGPLNLVYYLDKATPGNEKRPDNGCAAQCIYFTILQVPAWFRSRRNGWIPFAYVFVHDQKSAAVTDSMLVRYLIRCFEETAGSGDTGIACTI